MPYQSNMLADHWPDCERRFAITFLCAQQNGQSLLLHTYDLLLDMPSVRFRADKPDVIHSDAFKAHLPIAACVPKHRHCARVQGALIGTDGKSSEPPMPGAAHGMQRAYAHA